MATIGEMIDQLQSDRAVHAWEGCPEHLLAYYYDAIQALERLNTQLRNADILRDSRD